MNKDVKKTLANVVKTISVLLSVVIMGLVIVEYSGTEIEKAIANLTITSD